MFSDSVLPFIPVDSLVEDTRYALTVQRAAGDPVTLHFRLVRPESAAQAQDDEVVLTAREQLEILKRLDTYPALFDAVADFESGAAWCKLAERGTQLLTEGEAIYIFGAHKVGAITARRCLRQGVHVKGFIDNDTGKQGTELDGIPIKSLADIASGNEPIVVASGRYGNEILAQVKTAGRSRVMNMHELLFALHMPHQAESNAREFTSAVFRQPYRFVSALLQLHDEESRAVFDGLIHMRTTLDMTAADRVKSDFNDEYLDGAYIGARDMRYYVDAGAYTGDTLDRFEARFAKAERAYLFEPDLPPYYASLKRYADRDEVFSYNFGLARSNSKFRYRPEYSFDTVQQLDSAVPASITTFGQGIPLDDILHNPVTLFKLDIEGAEAEALRGAARIIREHAPKLCVCAYHRADDLWQLIDVVKRIRPDYKVGLRHYSDIFDDTTLYFF